MRPEALAENLLHLLQDDDFQSGLVRRGKGHVRRLSFDSVGQVLEGVVARALSS